MNGPASPAQEFPRGAWVGWNRGDIATWYLRQPSDRVIRRRDVEAVSPANVGGNPQLSSLRVPEHLRDSVEKAAAGTTHEATATPRGDGTYLISCPYGCNLGSSRVARDEYAAATRQELHRLTTKAIRVVCDADEARLAAG